MHRRFCSVALGLLALLVLAPVASAMPHNAAPKSKPVKGILLSLGDSYSVGWQELPGAQPPGAAAAKRSAWPSAANPAHNNAAVAKQAIPAFIAGIILLDGFARYRHLPGLSPARCPGRPGVLNR